MSFPPGMTADGDFDARPVRAFLPGPELRVDASVWPASVPAVAPLLQDGLGLPAGLTVLVGENGSRKSTVVEALAEAYGLNPQGGSAHGRTFRVRPSEPHSPILAAIPRAHLLELGPWGIRPVPGTT